LNVQSPRADALSVTSTQTTLVEDGTKIKGSLSSTVPVLVHGIIEGDLESPAVTVSATGSVSGMVLTKALSSVGKIAGEFDVDRATVAGSVAVKTVVRAQEMDFKLDAKDAGKKIELRFGAVNNK
jgi:cytoskeletal protein CcmA (bactofilin family)